ncbi:MAG: helix-turn-helix transcriptional regulator [Acidobacteria bacterium]|nr:helix-turn-helix transcriptional regulator [Acidobacteriota bacterium]
MSRREEDIARLLIAGATTRGIASALFLSEHTVRTHIEHCMQKLGASSRGAMVARLLGTSRGQTARPRNPPAHAAGQNPAAPATDWSSPTAGTAATRPAAGGRSSSGSRRPLVLSLP